MTGEIYLYLSTAATFIEIIHPDFGKTEYWLPEDLCGFCGYEMVVVGDFKGEEEKTKELLLAVGLWENAKKKIKTLKMNYEFKNVLTKADTM